MPDLTNLGAHSPAEEAERLDAVERVYAGKSETPRCDALFREHYGRDGAPTELDDLYTLARALEKETARLRLALSKIARWYGEFPKVVDPEGKKCSYAAAYGSNGERDYMRMVAQDALSPAPTKRADK